VVCFLRSTHSYEAQSIKCNWQRSEQTVADGRKGVVLKLNGRGEEHQIFTEKKITSRLVGAMRTFNGFI